MSRKQIDKKINGREKRKQSLDVTSINKKGQNRDRRKGKYLVRDKIKKEIIQKVK